MNVDAREGTRCKLVCEFFDLVMLDNSYRATQGEVPLDFKEAKERWEDVLIRNDLRPGGNAGQERAASANPDGKQSRGGNGSGAKAKTPASASASRPKSSFGGKQLCYDFNRKAGCTRRVQVSGGCKDAKAAEYAHVCNFWDTSSSKYCYAAHCRETNH